MAGLVPAVREVTDDRTVIRAMARRFGAISWISLGILVVTGVAMLMVDFEFPTILVVKVGLVILATGLAAWHSVSGAMHSPRLRGMTQGLILLLGLIIVALALAI